jgi:hypothetical protein
MSESERVSHEQILDRAAFYLRTLKAQRAEFEEDRREHGWTARNPYCVHGTYIGDPYGADYICGLCEDGTTDYQIALAWAHRDAEVTNNALAVLDEAYMAIVRAHVVLRDSLDASSAAGVLLGFYLTKEKEIRERWGKETLAVLGG